MVVALLGAGVWIGCGDDASSAGGGGGGLAVTATSAADGGGSMSTTTAVAGGATGAGGDAGGGGGRGAGGAGGAGDGAGGGAFAPGCDDLAPGDGGADAAAIQTCLDTAQGRARLRAGAVFELEAALRVGTGDVLEGASEIDPPTLRPAVASAPFATVSNAIVNVENDARGPLGGTLRDVRLDLRDARSGAATLFGVRVAYDDNLVQRVEITSTPMPWRLTRAVSLYFGTGFRNLAEDMRIHGAGLGVVFVNGITRAMAPRVARATITDNRGDAVTFAGYGEVVDSDIARNGWDDGDSGAGTRLPPGGALYASHVNQEGGLIEGNTIADACGADIELNMTQGFTVADNVITDPGYPGMNGMRSAIRPGEDSYDVPAGFCKATMTILMIATRGSELRDNVVLNVGRPANVSGASSNGGSEDWFGPDKADLPSPQGTSIALALLLGRQHRDTAGELHYAVGNRFIRNVLGAWDGGDAGLGWFTGRGTGYGPGGIWDAATTANVLDDNTHCAGNDCTAAPHSRRCGQNRYGTGETTCVDVDGGNRFDGPGGNHCNRDDLTHEGNGHDARRNDGCTSY